MQVLKLNIKNTTVIKYYLLIFFLSISVNAATYYVTTEGNNSNDGLSESTAWKTLKYASNNITAGDTVYIKAGIYNNENVKLPNGFENFPIVIEGYKNTPGDVTNIDWWDYENNRELDPTKMPVLDGGNRATAGTAVVASSYSIVKNLQITNYNNGCVTWSGSHYTLENMIITNIGSIDVEYDGRGIGLLYGVGYNTVKNCVVYNSAAEGIMVYNNEYNLLENVKVYCDQSPYYANTHYYFQIESNNNTIRNCYIERVGNLEHNGHGFEIKGDGQEYFGNLFENCKAKNMEIGGFVLRHRKVHNNTFKNCISIGGIGILIRDGATHNNFYNMKTVDCSEAVSFMDTGEDEGKQFAGRFNDFYNCVFENSTYAIDFNSYNLNSDANDNRFINCIFDGGSYLFNSGRTNYDNKMINCVVTNVTNYKSGGDVDFYFKKTNFWNNSFNIPEGTDLLKADPLFVDAANGNYNLSNNSPCIDAGIVDTTGLNLPHYDLVGNLRIFDGNGDGNAIVDMGVNEYNSTPVSINENKIAVTTKFNLFQNYPNPFNPSTVISFTLSTSQNVMLAVYNMLGEKIAELVNGNMSEGNHSVTFDASNLSSGIYIYRISTDNFASNKKMLLIK